MSEAGKMTLMGLVRAALWSSQWLSGKMVGAQERLPLLLCEESKRSSYTMSMQSHH